MGEVKKRGTQRKIGDNQYKTLDLGTGKNEIIEQLQIVEYNDLEDMVFRMELISSEIEKIFDMNYVNTSTIGYTQ